MKKYKRLAVFDLDGTLLDTPLPEIGKVVYETKTGNQWPHLGWWGQPMSLDTEIFEIPVIQHVIEDYLVEKEDPDTMVVMLTGRMVKLTDLVKKILHEKKLTFHEYHFNKGGSTESAKIKTLTKILEEQPTIKDITLWDDREAHIPIFQQWGDEQIESGRVENFKINVVPSERH